jgi:hypothetical protein
MHGKTKKGQMGLSRLSSAYWWVAFDNPPLHVVGSQLGREFREIIVAVEADEETTLVRPGLWQEKNGLPAGTRSTHRRAAMY